MSPSRRTVTIAAVILVLAVVGWAAVVVAVVVTGSRDEARPADAIAVLGAAQYNGRPSPVFRARLDHAAQLFRSGIAPVLLVTGGIGNRDTVSEAEVGRRYLLQRGLPAGALVALPPAGTTIASLDGLAIWFRARPGRRVVLVSDGFHLLRLRMLASRRGLTAYTSPARESPIGANVRLNAGYVLAEGWKVPFAWMFYR